MELHHAINIIKQADELVMGDKYDIPILLEGTHIYAIGFKTHAELVAFSLAFKFIMEELENESGKIKL